MIVVTAIVFAEPLRKQLFILKFGDFMSYIQWEEKYNIGISEIDSQHIKLVAICNNFYENYLIGKDLRELNQLFIELLEYTRYHFRSEEELMKKSNYPTYDFHVKLHKILIDDIYNLYDEFEKGNPGISLDVLSFLKSWLLDHIMENDKKIAEYM
jgi:hemerythrin